MECDSKMGIIQQQVHTLEYKEEQMRSLQSKIVEYEQKN